MTMSSMHPPAEQFVFAKQSNRKTDAWLYTCLSKISIVVGFPIMLGHSPFIEEINVRENSNNQEWTIQSHRQH
jgi:hypothetical protein